MAADTPPIVLFGYDSSPFTQKIRLTLRLLQLPYTFVLVPSMMPRPVLVDNFNLTYRKIPVLVIGKELIVDTSLIVEWLHSDPRLRAYRGEKARTDGRNGGQEVHHDARSRVLARLLSSHYTDRPLFRLTTGLIPSVVWRTSFGKDRAGLIGHKLDADKLERKVPKNLAGLDTFLSILEPLFAGEEGWLLGGEKPSAADVSLYYQLDWGERISRGEGIEDLTGGGTADGFGQGMREVFNSGRYPSLLGWYERFRKYIDGSPSTETRVERGDEKGVDEVMKRLEQSGSSEKVPLLPTPCASLETLEKRNGLDIGKKVSVAPQDTGQNYPTVGTLVGISPEEVVIMPDVPQAVGKVGRKARIEGVRLHFPRVEFVVAPAKVDRAKL
ncbi:hypothetical protein PMZ80_002827 [Knufia obscura]|uniref:GST N-terminal domain-containing protein n=2 Tax=Knufia TaxID=430999 RepID=A0AAN8EN38_9EURO|nr:hypothetical protein PMZ80_002827 [Knufia obscura]KAK5948418.1 hypothetical protein OHC33_010592 [Knufia fluminis]